MQNSKPADWIVHQCRYQLCREHCHCDVPRVAMATFTCYLLSRSVSFGNAGTDVIRECFPCTRPPLYRGRAPLSRGPGWAPSAYERPWQGSVSRLCSGALATDVWNMDGRGIWACVLGLVLSMWTAALRLPAWAILTPRGCWEMEAVHSSCVIGCRSSPFISFNTGVLTSMPVIDHRCPEASGCQSFESQIEMMYSVACFVYHLRWQKCSVHLFSLWTRVPKPSVCVSDKYIQASRMSILGT